MSLTSTIRKGLVAVKLITGHDRDVLASEKETQELYQEAVNNGRAPGNTSKIHFLGDARAGKTSLCKKLRGEKFDPQENPTHGIGTKMCKVNEVDDDTWKESSDGNEESTEFVGITTWYLAKQLAAKETSHEKTAMQLKDLFIFVQIIFIVTLSLSLPVLLSLVFGHSWTFYVLISLSALVALTVGSIDMYRVMSGTAFAPLIFRLLVNSDCWMNYIQISLQNQTCLLMMKWILCLLILGFFFGFFCGCGLRVTIIYTMTCVWLPREPVLINWGIERGTLIFEMFMIGIVIGIGLQSIFPKLGYQAFLKLTGHGLPVHLQQYALLFLFQIGIVCLLSGWKLHESLVMMALGILFGMCVVIGLIQGRKIFVTIESNILYCIPGILVACLFAYACDLIPVYECPSFLSILGIVFRAGLMYRAQRLKHHMVTESNVPVKTISDKLFQAAAKDLDQLKLKKKLSLWDFAGQDLYYNTHHAFMASHAAYVLVFDLNRFTEPNRRFVEYQRIHFWLQSICTHTVSPVILVGTHADQVDSDTITATIQILAPKLSMFTLVNQCHLVPNGASPFYTIDNSGSLADDTTKLRSALKQVTDRIGPMKNEYPIRWRQFLETIHAIRRKVDMKLAPQSSLVMTIQELQHQLQGYNPVELRQMLMFFNDAGEIIYDAVDCVLRQFVVFDPQYLVDFMYYLNSSSAQHVDQVHLSAYWSLLHSQGILHDELAKSFFGTANEEFSKVLLTLLEAKDLLFKVGSTNDANMNNIGSCHSHFYIVPSMLPRICSTANRPCHQEWTKRFYIDFEQFHPHAVLSRLMSRCATYSHISHESRSMCRDGGIFSLSDQFCFQLHLLIPCPTQHLIEVAIRAVPGSNPLDLLRHLWRILETIRHRDFPRLRYKCGINCPHPPPHQGCPDGNVVHVIPLASHVSPFTEEEKVVRLCFTRLVEMDPSEEQCTFGRSNSTKMEEAVTVSGTSPNNIDHKHGPIDAYISCSPRDDSWVKENIIRVLSSLPHSLTIQMNKYDHPNQSNMIINAHILKESPVVIVVCTKHYCTDPTGRLRYEREMAYRYGIKLIPIVLPNCSIPGDIYDVKPIHIQEATEGLPEPGIYDLLSREISAATPMG